MHMRIVHRASKRTCSGGCSMPLHRHLPLPRPCPAAPPAAPAAPATGACIPPPPGWCARTRCTPARAAPARRGRWAGQGAGQHCGRGGMQHNSSTQHPHRSPHAHQQPTCQIVSHPDQAASMWAAAASSPRMRSCGPRGRRSPRCAPGAAPAAAPAGCSGGRLTQVTQPLHAVRCQVLQ